MGDFDDNCLVCPLYNFLKNFFGIGVKGYLGEEGI